MSLLTDNSVTAKTLPMSDDGNHANGVAERFALQTQDGNIAGCRFANLEAPPLLFAHANGFCASAYRQVLAPLSAHYDVYAIDLRGHGGTTLPLDPARHRSWRVFATDISLALDALSVRREHGTTWILAGHSMGAVSSLLAAAGRRDVPEVRMIEPVFVPDIFALAMSLPEPIWKGALRRSPMVRGALGRRRHWPDRATALQSYSVKQPFSRWAPDVLQDYLEDGLKNADGGVVLSCPPEWEAANYMALSNPVWSSARRFTGKLRLLVGAEGSTAPRWSQRRILQMGGIVEIAEGCSHLVPMQNPARAAAFLQAR